MKVRSCSKGDVSWGRQSCPSSAGAGYLFEPLIWAGQIPSDKHRFSDRVHVMHHEKPFYPVMYPETLGVTGSHLLKKELRAGWS